MTQKIGFLKKDEDSALDYGDNGIGIMVWIRRRLRSIDSKTPIDLIEALSSKATSVLISRTIIKILCVVVSEA